MSQCDSTPAKPASRICAPRLSFCLRNHECIKHFEVAQVAAVCTGLTDAVIAQRFGFTMHPTLKAWLDQEAVQRPHGNARIGRGSPYKLIRECFYHTDLYSLCSPISVRYLDGPLKAVKVAVKAARALFKSEPVTPLRDRPLSELVANHPGELAECLLVKLMMTCSLAALVGECLTPAFVRPEERVVEMNDQWPYGWEISIRRSPCARDQERVGE